MKLLEERVIIFKIKNFGPVGHKQENRQPKLKYNLEIFTGKGGN